MRTQRTLLGAFLITGLAVLLVACGSSQPQAAAQPPALQAAPAAEAAAPGQTEAGQAEAQAGRQVAEAHQEDEAGSEEAGEHQEAGGAHQEGEGAGEHSDEKAHGPSEHMAGNHGVPAEAAAVPNPVPATEESTQIGARVYAQNCAVCHGEKGRGDGPAAAGLEKKPADLHAEHVQENSDGAMFWIITHGKPETPMPPWEDVLTEEERWHVVNFMRTFAEGEGAQGHERTGAQAESAKEGH